MADLKPLGSEKLQGDDKLKRILELTYYGDNKKSPNTLRTANAEYLSESINGFKYGIVKEKDGYYVKKGLNESSLDYIGGLFMKNKNRFNSYAEALKRLELLSGSELNESTKYVLKQKQTEPPINDLPSPESDLPPSPESDLPPSPESDLPPSPESDLPPSPEGGAEDLPTETGKPSDYMAEIQKFSGKLGQELRDQRDKMKSDDIKYVLNMVISAVDLESLEDDDIEEIGKKFSRDIDDNTEIEGDDLPSEDEESNSEPESDSDLGEIHSMDKLESFINTPISTDEEIDLSKYADLGSVDETKEIDLDEIKNDINKSISDTLGKYFK
jgi:hypothetical protein